MPSTFVRNRFDFRVFTASGRVKKSNAIVKTMKISSCQRNASGVNEMKIIGTQAAAAQIVVKAIVHASITRNTTSRIIQNHAMKNKFTGNILSAIEFFVNSCYNFRVGKNPKEKANPQNRAIFSAKFAAAICAVILCAAFSSCKKKAQRTLEERTELSMKIDEAREKAAWSYEIEGERLSKKISSVDAIEKNIPLEPISMIALEGGRPFPAIFPELEGFTALDTTDIQGEVLDTVSGFCRALIEHTSPSRKSDSKKNESEEKKSESEEEDAQEDSSKIDGYFPENTLYSLVLFLADSEEAGAVKSFVVGKPFVDDENIEVPLRLSCENATVYALAYPAPHEESWKIQQIEIYKVEEKNGKTHGN